MFYGISLSSGVPGYNNKKEYIKSRNKYKRGIQKLYTENSHDFSASDHGLREKITHLLYHLKDNRSNVRGVLSSESGELFMQYFKEYLAAMFKHYPESLKEGVPQEFALNHLVGSFAEAVKWWIRTRMKMPAEELADNYLMLIGYNGRARL